MLGLLLLALPASAAVSVHPLPSFPASVAGQAFPAARVAWRCNCGRHQKAHPADEATQGALT